MEISVSTLEETLKRKLNASYVDVRDTSGVLPDLIFIQYIYTNFANRALSSKQEAADKASRLLLCESIHPNCYWRCIYLVISSLEFKGKTTLARHRLVNNTLKDEIANVHAWTQKCYTEEEWEKRAQDAAVSA